MAGAIAFIADIHGNIWALDAVLADIRRRGIESVFNLGDSIYGPLEPRATAERLIEARIPSLRGNQDRILIEPPRGEGHPTLRYTMSSLGAEHLDWLRDQPCTVEYSEYLLCHGTPFADDVYLIEGVNAAGVWLRRSEEMETLIAGVAQQVVLCGHSHIPRVVELSGGKRIVNPGSVGLPAYADDEPFPHRMETGSPHARYAVIEGDGVNLIAIPYDHEKAAAKARENGRHDWAIAIDSGFARPV